MTEYSKGSKNKIETVSQTNGKTNPNPFPTVSHPRTDNPSKYTEESQASTGPMEGFEIHIQNILPLISAIKDQNEQIKYEKALIEADMKKLSELADSLLEENHKMRRHYGQRTKDISKLVESISINMNEEFNDINHQSHLIREANLIIVKKIQDKMKILAEMDSKSKIKQSELTSFIQKNLQKDDKMRKTLAKNKLLFNQCQNLKFSLKNLNNESLEKQVNELVTSVCYLKRHNLSNTRQAISLLKKNKTQKPQLQSEQMSILEMIKVLQIQAKQMSDQSAHFQSKLDNAIENHIKKYNKKNERQKVYEKNKLVIDLQLNELMTMQKEINNLKLKGKKQTLDQIQRAQTQKKKLINQISNKKSKIQNIQSNLQQKRQQITVNHRKRVEQIKSEVSNEHSKIFEQLLLKLNPEAANVENILDQRKLQYSHIMHEVQSLKRAVQNLDNPIKQIMKLDYALKKQAPTRK